MGSTASFISSTSRIYLEEDKNKLKAITQLQHLCIKHLHMCKMLQVDADLKHKGMGRSIFPSHPLAGGAFVALGESPSPIFLHCQCSFSEFDCQDMKLGSSSAKNAFPVPSLSALVALQIPVR